MSEHAGKPPEAQSREVVGLFSDRRAFEAAIEDLRRAGFERTDLSVLASHESLDAAGTPGRPWGETLRALIGELKYEGPLVASGAIFLAGGPTAALFAGVIGAAVGGMAVKELLDEVTATPHTEDFARSIAAGSVILWVRVADDAAADRASQILAANGAGNVHTVETAVPPTEARPAD